MDCKDHKNLTETVDEMGIKVEGIYKVQGSILDHHAKIFQKLEDIEKGMRVEVGNGHSIKMPLNEVIAKLVDDENIRKVLFTRAEKKFWYVWGRAIVGFGVTIFIALCTIFGTITATYMSNQSKVQAEQSSKQNIIIANQEQLKSWIQIDSANGERREKDIRNIKNILMVKFKIPL